MARDESFGAPPSRAESARTGDGPWGMSAEPEAVLQSLAETARAFSLTPRALRFYEAKGLLSPQRRGAARLYDAEARQRLTLIVQAKRLGFTLCEIRRMLEDGSDGGGTLPISRRQCFEQIRLLEQRKREIDVALVELRHVYSSFYVRLASGSP